MNADQFSKLWNALVGLKSAAEEATDVMVAFGRTADDLVRKCEDEMTDAERLRYYELRDKGVLPIDAIERIHNESGDDA